MKQFLIVKLDTPCTLTKSAMRVPQAEPYNMAKTLISALGADGELVDVVMLGHEFKEERVGEHSIRTLGYYGDPKTIASQIYDDCTLIIWQGRHIFGLSKQSSPHQFGNRAAMMSPYSAGDYERLCLVKLWQVQMYNLLTAKFIAALPRKYAIITDLRLPLLELNAVDPVAVPKPLPADIVMLTQAYHHDEYNKWQAKYGNGMHYPEFDITDITYKFRASKHLPLEYLPFVSHSQFKGVSKTERRAIFQVQSIKYIDDYRKKQLTKAIKRYHGNVALHGRFAADEMAMLAQICPEYEDELRQHIIDNSNKPSEYFVESASILAKHTSSLIITDERYARFGLMPNRFAEALSTGVHPDIDESVYEWCSPFTKSLAKEVKGKNVEGLYALASNGYNTLVDEVKSLFKQ